MFLRYCPGRHVEQFDKRCSVLPRTASRYARLSAPVRRPARSDTLPEQERSQV